MPRTLVFTAGNSLNPFLGPFTSTDEWLDAVAAATQKAFPHLEGVNNTHKDLIPDVKLAWKRIDAFQLMVFAEPGANEGHYMKVKALAGWKDCTVHHLLCAKTFDGLDYAIAAAGFVTRCIHTVRS